MNLPQAQGPTLAEQLSLGPLLPDGVHLPGPWQPAEPPQTPLAAGVIGHGSGGGTEPGPRAARGGRRRAAAVRLWNVARPDHPVRPGQAVRPAEQALYAAAQPQTQGWAWPERAIRCSCGTCGPAVHVQLGHPLTGPAGTVYALAFSPSRDRARRQQRGRHGAAVDDGRGRRGARRHQAALPVTTRETTCRRSRSIHQHRAGRRRSRAARWPGGRYPNAKGTETDQADGAAHPEGPGRRGVLGRVHPGRPRSPRPQGQDRVAVGRDQPGPAARASSRGPPAGSTRWRSAGRRRRGSLLADGSSDGSAQLWDVATATPVATLPDPGPGHHAGLDSGQHLITGAADGSVRVWALSAGRAGRRHLVNAVAFSAAHPDMLAVASGNLQLWDAVRRFRCRGPARHQSPGGAARFGAGGGLPGRDAADVPGDHGRRSRLVSEGTVQASDTGYVENVAYLAQRATA